MDQRSQAAIDHYQAARRAAVASGPFYDQRTARAAAALVDVFGGNNRAAAAAGVDKAALSRGANRGRNQGKDQTAPAATCLGFVNLDSPKGVALRRETVHTLQLPAILGVGPVSHEDALNQAVAQRWGRPAPLNSEAADMGKRHVPTLVALFAERHPDYAALATGMWRGTGARSYQRATPGRLLVDPEDKDLRALSTLTVTSFPRPFTEEEGWGEDGSSQVPEWLAIRAQWEMDTLGLTQAHVMALSQGAYVREYHLTRDETRAEHLRTAALNFIDHVLAILPSEET